MATVLAAKAAGAVAVAAAAAAATSPRGAIGHNLPKGGQTVRNDRKPVKVAGEFGFLPLASRSSSSRSGGGLGGGGGGGNLLANRTQELRRGESKQEQRRRRPLKVSAQMAPASAAAVDAFGGKITQAPRIIVVSDLDNTMVDHSDHENHALLRQFNELWTSKFSDSRLIFSTGRSPTLYHKLREEVPLLVPDITVCSVGTEILYGSSDTPDAGWEAILNVGWDRKIVLEEAGKFPQLRLQQESEQRPHKVSFNIDPAEAANVIASLTSAIESRNINAVLVYSGKWDLDIMPARAGKGKALTYVLLKLAEAGLAPTQGVLVCGDSGNDADLFVTPGVHGVVVGNSHQELVDFVSQHPELKVHRAGERCAGGIVEALKAFGFVSSS